MSGRPARFLGPERNTELECSKMRAKKKSVNQSLNPRRAVVSVLRLLEGVFLEHQSDIKCIHRELTTYQVSRKNVCLKYLKIASGRSRGILQAAAAFSSLPHCVRQAALHRSAV